MATVEPVTALAVASGSDEMTVPDGTFSENSRAETSTSKPTAVRDEVALASVAPTTCGTSVRSKGLPPPATQPATEASTAAIATRMIPISQGRRDDCVGAGGSRSSP